MKETGDKKKNISVRKVGREIYRLLLFGFIILGSSVIVFASTQLLIGFAGYLRTRAVYNDANNRFVSIHARTPKTGGQEEQKEPEPAANPVSANKTVSEDEVKDPVQDINVDLKSLKAINDEVVGWIYFEDGMISYPVLFSGDNEKYLKRNYKGKYMAAGSIFMEGKSAGDFSDHYTLLYGHNMRDLTMFGKLRYYRSDKDYYKDHAYFRIITEDHDYRYKVFSYKQISSDSDVFSVIDKDSGGLEKFAKQYLLSNSNVGSDVTIKDSDHVLALSTCVNDYAYRFIVCGVRVEDKYIGDGEEPESDSVSGDSVSGDKADSASENKTDKDDEADSDDTEDDGTSSNSINNSTNSTSGNQTDVNGNSPLTPGVTTTQTIPGVTADPATPGVTTTPATPGVTTTQATPGVTTSPTTPAVTTNPATPTLPTVNNTTPGSAVNNSGTAGGAEDPAEDYGGGATVVDVSF